MLFDFAPTKIGLYFSILYKKNGHDRWWLIDRSIDRLSDVDDDDDDDDDDDNDNDNDEEDYDDGDDDDEEEDEEDEEEEWKIK